MVLTKDYKKTIADRARRDPKFAQAMLDGAATLFLNGEPEAARIVLWELVNSS